jgi:hypothetical protein
LGVSVPLFPTHFITGALIVYLSGKWGHNRAMIAPRNQQPARLHWVILTVPAISWATWADPPLLKLDVFPGTTFHFVP